MKIAKDVRKKFFNRNGEYVMVVDYLNDEPSRPFLLLGPVNSGKSALLKSIMEEEKSRVIYLNCGIVDVSTPELMAMELRSQARKLPSVVGMQFIKLLASQLGPVSKVVQYLVTLIGGSLKSGDGAAVTGQVMNEFMNEFFPKDSATNLSAIIASYKDLLKKVPPGQKKPIIVIDEVNALKRWKIKDEEHLTNLLEFFKRICKEEELSQIVLASSDFSMASWLRQKGFDDTQRRVEVLGDLTSAEAFVYVCGGKVRNRKGYVEDWPGLMAQSEQTLALGMTPEDWKKVWSVCGGNMYLLQNCVANAREYNSWEKGVIETLSEPQEGITSALERPELIDPPTGSTGPRIWESEHFKAVLRLIAASPYHAVRRREVHAALEKVGISVENVSAAQVLLSMVEYNVLSLRPYSNMAQDIPREAFFKKVGSKEKKDSVVTMRSPAHLAAVLELDVELEQVEIKNPQAAEGNRQASS